jgi:hypothetical protein
MNTGCRRRSVRKIILAFLLFCLAIPAAPSWAQVYEPRDKDEVDRERQEERKWLFIDQTKLKPGKDRVKVLVGWERGRVDSFKFRVRERTVEITEVEAHYGKGAKDVYEVDTTFKVGSETGTFVFDRSKKSYLRKLYIRFRFPEIDEEDRGDREWKQPTVLEIVGRRKTS